MTRSNTDSYITPDDVENIEAKFELITEAIDHDNFSKAKSLLLDLHYADLADYLHDSSSEMHRTVIDLLESDFPAQALVCLNHSIKVSVTKIMMPAKIAELINALSIEDAIEVIEDMEDDIKDEIVNLLPLAKQKDIKEGFAYPERSTGRIMEKNYVVFVETDTVLDAIQKLKNKKNLSKDIYAAIIVDSGNKPVGYVLLSNLLVQKGEVTLKSLMYTDFKIADTFTDQKELAYVFRHYELEIVPIVNKRGNLVGTISLNSMVYIIEEEAEEEIMRMGGVNANDIYSKTVSTSAKRFPWLFANLILSCITALVIGLFEGTIAQKITLALVMPVVVSLSGNAGTQTSTVAVRSLANKDITSFNASWIICKEALVCSINGILIGVIGGVLIFLLFHDAQISIVFSIAIIINFLIAGFLGAAIPIFLNNMDIDPALASAVFLTAITDSIGFFSFLGLAYFML